MASRYTDKQKVAYYKKLAAANQAKGASYNTTRYQKPDKSGKSKTYKKKVYQSAYDIETGYGSRLGSVVGEGAERLFNAMGGTAGVKAAVSGLGSYKIKHNSLILNEGNSPPSVVNTKDGRFIIRHREYIRDVIVPANNNGAFVVTGFKVNPGLQATFPWLSSIAQNFQQYRLNGCLFEFKSNYSEFNSAQPGMGTVILAAEYDSTLPLFSSKQIMENHQYAMSAKPSLSQIHPIECARGVSVLQNLYVRQTVPDDNNDLRFSDFCNFQFGYAGIPNNANPVNLGELWVSYEIQLMKPQLAGSGTLMMSSYWTNTAGISSSAVFGTLSTMQADPSNEISANFSYATNTATISLSENIGACRILFSVTEAFTVTGVRPSFGLIAVSNCVVPTPVWGAIQNFQAPGAGETTSRQTWQTYVDCTGSGPATFTFQQATNTAVAQVYLCMTTMDSSIGRNPLVPYLPWISTVVTLDEHHDFEEAHPGAYITSSVFDDSDKDIDQWVSTDISQSTALNIADIVEKARAKKLASMVHK